MDALNDTMRIPPKLMCKNFTRNDGSGRENASKSAPNLLQTQA